jgi:hypothetical protein
MAAGGRFECTLTVPVGGWDISANAGGGAFTATIPAGDYFAGELVTEVQDQLNAGPGGNWLFTKNWGEDDAGTVTISCTSSFSITWTDADLGLILGHADISTTAGPVTGASPAIGIWIPACPKWSPYGDEHHDRYSDLRQSVGPAGGVKTLVGNTFDAVEGLRWDMVSNARAVGSPNGVADLFCWQGWWSMVATGSVSYVSPGKPVQFYWDADLGSSVAEYDLIFPADTKVPQVVNGWTGLYRIEMPMMILRSP